MSDSDDFAAALFTEVGQALHEAIDTLESRDAEIERLRRALDGCNELHALRAGAEKVKQVRITELEAEVKEWEASRQHWVDVSASLRTRITGLEADRAALRASLKVCLDDKDRLRQELDLMTQERDILKKSQAETARWMRDTAKVIRDD